jgi:uncharacterized protein
MPSMSEISQQVFLQMLKSLSANLDKAAAHVEANGVDASELLDARLAPDMFPLARQVQIATDHAKGATARLSGRDNPKYEDNESTFDQLQARIAKTIAFVASIPKGEIDGSEGKEVTITPGGKQRKLSGQRYLLGNALPNFFFHVTTAYDILRHKGVGVGKQDFLGEY